MISQPLAKHLYSFEYENAFLLRPLKNLAYEKNEQGSDFWKGSCWEWQWKSTTSHSDGKTNSQHLEPLTPAHKG